MSRKDPRMIAEIMKNNFKGSFKNPIVVIVLIALIILPSLYALLNIQACWDPYGKTGDIEFAIANVDNGSTFNGKDINIGNELEKELKNNDKFKWTFVSEDELRRGVYNGTYYAGIIMPENLSSNVVSITGDNPQQAKLQYIVNMKTNPVAAKLTDTGANTVYTSLNAKIVEIIDLAAYQKLGELQAGLAKGARDLASGGNQLKAGASKVSSGAKQVKDGEGQVKKGEKKVKDGEKKVSDGADKVKAGVPAVNDGADKVKSGSEDLKDGADQIEKGSEELEAAVDPSLMPDGPVKEYAEGNVELAEGSEQLADGADQLANGTEALAEGSTKLANGSGQVADGASQLANGSVELAEGSVEMAEGSVALASGAELLSNSAAGALFTASGSLGSTADMLGTLTGIDEDVLGDYVLAPVKLDKQEMFPVNSYGTDVSPFYLVLSMWVGGIITCVMLHPGTSQGTKYSPFEMYFGKLLTYIIMSILQACVTVCGCYILGVQIVNAPLFIFSCILVSMIFMIVIYSIISAIGTVGKGLVVILLVFQISATGGVYPIEIMHQFFKTLYPFMPMTYGINLVREAQLGVVWSNYYPALTFLLVLGIVTITIAVIIKEKLDKPSHYFEEKLKESGLF